jgi:hypothetical protein
MLECIVEGGNRSAKQVGRASTAHAAMATPVLSLLTRRMFLLAQSAAYAFCGFVHFSPHNFKGADFVCKAIGFISVTQRKTRNLARRL